MKYLARAVICFAVIALVGCVTCKEAVKRSTLFNACIGTCQQHRNTCSQVCHQGCQDCTITAHRSTIRHYCQYKNEQYVKGGIVARELKSYDDPLQCKKITCDCWADYRVCIQSCLGKIKKRLQIAPGCC